MSVAELCEARAFRIAGHIGFEDDLAKLVYGSAGWTGDAHLDTSCLVSFVRCLLSGLMSTRLAAVVTIRVRGAGMFMLRVFQSIALAGLVFLCVGCGAPSPLQTLEPGEEGRVVRVLDGDSLVLDTGLSVRLVGVEAPYFGRGDDPDQPYAEGARRLLEDLTIGRRVRLYYPGLTRDRYDRALAHIETIDNRGPRLWVNRVLIEKGAGRVRAYPDTAKLTEDLLVSEATARAEQLGVWAHSEFQPVAADTVSREVKGFFIVTATLSDPLPTDRPGQLCAFGLNNASLRLIADASAPALCQMEVGTRLRVRGYVSSGRLYLTHNSNIESLN